MGAALPRPTRRDNVDPRHQLAHADVASTWCKGFSQSGPSAWLPALPALFTCLVLRPRSRTSHLSLSSLSPLGTAPTSLTPHYNRSCDFFVTFRARFGTLCLWIDEESARVGLPLSFKGRIQPVFARFLSPAMVRHHDHTMCKSHSAQWVKWCAIDVLCVLWGVLGCVEGGCKGFDAFHWPMWCFFGHVDLCWCDLLFLGSMIIRVEWKA